MMRVMVFEEYKGREYIGTKSIELSTVRQESVLHHIVLSWGEPPSGSLFFGLNFVCITHHLICPQVSQTALKAPEIAELSGLCPEPRWGPKTASQTPSSRAAAGVARCDAFYSHPLY